ncbi:MAG: hypothetical protein ACC660_05250 [Acidimicrobiales bacterium]
MTSYNVDDYRSTRTTSGWVVFSGVVITIAATLNLIYGITLLVNDDWIVLTPQALIRFDLTTVGVIYLIFAAFQFFVAMGVFHGELWARVLAIVGASLGIVAQMAFMSIYPAWSWLVIIIDGLIIYGLAVHGDEVAEL